MPEAKFEPIVPKEALDYMKDKTFAFGFDYRDVWKEEHAVAFTVAKAMRADVLASIKTAVETAIAKGQSFEEFQQNLEPELVRLGWWGKQKMQDPLTGKLKEVTLGTPRRLKIIYETNLAQAYHCGEWQRFENVKKYFPALKYLTRNPLKARPAHRQWHNRVFAVDDPFWDEWMPLNGWNCHCRVIQVPREDIKQGKVKVEPTPSYEKTAWFNKRTGKTEIIPKGIDPGFNYNVGKARAKAITPTPNEQGSFKFAKDLKQPPMPEASKLPEGLVLPTL